MATSFNSKQYSNSLARQFYLNYDDTSVTTGAYTQADKMFMGFFQNAQAISDLTAWNSWVTAGPTAGTLPSYQDTYYPQFFYDDTPLWRNKMLYMVPCTTMAMVEKDATGSIEYNGQKWSEISSFDEEETTTDDEPRYGYFECDLKFYDSGLNVCEEITSEDLITGLALYKTEIKTDGTSETADWSAWSDEQYDSTTQYEYKISTTINDDTQYDYTKLRDANLTYLYQNTFPGVVRTTTLLTKFSLIVEF